MSKFEYRHLLPEDFAAQSRVWIYQSNRLLTMSEVLKAEDMLQDFVGSWNSHGDPVKGYGNIFFGQFVVLMADESATGVSGCSTDSSVRLIKAMEASFGIQLFDRQTLAFLQKDRIQLLPLSQLAYALQNNFITADTIYFNNTVLTKEDLETKWMVPVKDSWLAKRLPLVSSELK